ncbi:terpene synthase family protein [Streptomyces sp. TLI_171]|uniref:terpene synthase family protein n=1 Tax=Streptomyces sp. TLI_171 TaxID=1938859 RepID=UPI000C17C83F|nr:hypothetical protein [Streptomyces sp. TLI_171]RKE22377.1 hypothetical protein BX266_5821 [Streptomyces sp. TLI_171]
MSPATAQPPEVAPPAVLLDRVPAPPAHPHAEALHAEIGHWLSGTGLVDDAERFLGRGHLDLAARGWGDVPAGPGLRAAAKWLLLERILDDRIAELRRTDRSDEARGTLRDLAAVLAGPADPAPGPPATSPARALSTLRQDSAALAGAAWTARHDADLRAWLESSLDLLGTAGAVPTVPQYLSHRDRDGAARCAADRIELAHGLALPEQLHRHPQLTDLLARFAHLVQWIQDLSPAAAGRGAGLPRAVEVHEGLPADAATAKVAALCAAELTAFEFLADGIARGSHWPPQVRQYARALVRFVHALTHWAAGPRR